MTDNLEQLKKEVQSLNLKDNKDYLRFKTIRAELQEKYKDRFKRWRVAEYDFIFEKERKSFENYPSQGFEYYPSFEEHVKRHYSTRDFQNFEQEQYMYDDLRLQYRRRLVFNKE